MGEIAFKFQGEASIDLSDLMAAIVDMQTAGQDIEADVMATLDLEFQGEGTLLWHLAEHRVHSFQMSSDMTLLADVEADVEAMATRKASP